MKIVEITEKSLSQQETKIKEENMFDSNFHPIQRTMSRCTVFGSMSSFPSLIDDNDNTVYAGVNHVVGEVQQQEEERCARVPVPQAAAS